MLFSHSTHLTSAGAPLEIFFLPQCPAEGIVFGGIDRAARSRTLSQGLNYNSLQLRNALNLLKAEIIQLTDEAMHMKQTI